MQLKEKRFTTDILVIGGGFAGVFAAIRSKEQGFDVTLVDKGAVGRSGQTPWVDSFHVFDEEKGHTRETWINAVNDKGEGINNIGFLDMLMDDSKSIFEELKSWGAVNNPRFGIVLDRKVKEYGVDVISRTMITNLIKKNDRVVGAMGFPLDEENTSIIINAKAVINCAGAGSYKAHGFPIQGLTFDGDAISYRVGAEIVGKELNDFHFTFDKNPGSCWYQWGGKWGVGLYEENRLMPKHPDPDHNILAYLRAQNGELPIVFAPPHIPKKKGEKSELGVPKAPEGVIPRKSPDVMNMDEGFPIALGGAAAGMSIHKSEGVFPENGEVTFESCVEGLFAAGDALGSMLCGATYSGLGFSSASSCVQGARSGIAACEYAKTVELIDIDDEIIKTTNEYIFEPLHREKGYSPSWVIQQLQNTMIPYYVLYVKEEKRLQNALNNIMYISENIATKMRADDTHELKLAHEAKNMLLNAEMKLRSGMFRTETRGTHYREDYPEKNCEEWTAWVVIKQGEDGKMNLRKHNIN